MSRKGIIVAVLLVLAVAIAIWFYLDYRSAPSAQAPITTGTEQTAFAEDLLKDWPTISKMIPVKAGESGQWYIDAIRTIGFTTALVAFEDGLNGNTAVVSWNGSDYEIRKLYESKLQFTATELEAIEEQYGRPSYAPLNFHLSEGDGRLILGETNLFLKTSAATTKIKIAWLNPDGNLPNEVKPGDISGCDHVVLQDRTVPQTQAPLTAALNVLLADKTNSTPGNALYNYLAKGNLKLASVAIVSGIAKIYLTGIAPSLGGVCDDPRLFIQVAQTARQFSTVQKVELYVNGAKNDGSSNLKGE